MESEIMQQISKERELREFFDVEVHKKSEYWTQL
jgi:hypothetical protein